MTGSKWQDSFTPELRRLQIIVVAMIGMWVGFIVVAFTGRLPDGIQDFVAGTFQWMIRATAWVTGLTDEYPPFSLDVTPREAAS